MVHEHLHDVHTRLGGIAEFQSHVVETAQAVEVQSPFGEITPR
jgi:hypothetical protein